MGMSPATRALLCKGLYDSVPFISLTEQPVDYASVGPFWDDQQLVAMLGAIAKIGRDIEAACGGTPQDIEGVWRQGNITVVQSRPQVL
jgi:hypothetical protein